MTENRNFKKAARNRMACTDGLSYIQAVAEVRDELARIAGFGHLPVMWDVNDKGPWRVPTVKDHRAALGAIELAFRDLEVIHGAVHRDQWRTLDGHIDFDWDSGPFAHEVVVALLEVAEDPDAPGLRPGELRPGMNRLGSLNAVWLEGVRVRFRPYAPIGAEAANRLLWDRVRSRMSPRQAAAASL